MPFKDYSFFSFKRDRSLKAFYFFCLVNFVESTGVKESSSSSCMNSVNNACTSLYLCLIVPSFDVIQHETGNIILKETIIIPDLLHADRFS